jgi:hypothetical protein
VRRIRQKGKGHIYYLSKKFTDYEPMQIDFPDEAVMFATEEEPEARMEAIL